jgi:hypothetical protein
MIRREDAAMVPARPPATVTSDPPGARAHAPALLSSAARGWRGVTLEVHRASNVDLVMQHPHHVVSLLLRGPINLLQRRNGIASQAIMHAGDVIITPLGEPKLLRHREEGVILKLHVDPAFVESVVQELDGSVPRNLRLLDSFGTRDPQIEGIARALLAEAKSEDLASHIYVDALANQLVVHLLRRH